jgi:hypothetical protein
LLPAAAGVLPVMRIRCVDHRGTNHVCDKLSSAGQCGCVTVFVYILGVHAGVRLQTAIDTAFACHLSKYSERFTTVDATVWRRSANTFKVDCRLYTVKLSTVIALTMHVYTRRGCFFYLTVSLFSFHLFQLCLIRFNTK